MSNRLLFIIGMPGAGKTSLGKRVASNLHLPFVDMDQRIQDIVGCTVSDFFAQWGEAAFRTAETNLLMHLTREPSSIVSTGGGTVLKWENRAIMRAHGLIVLIDRPIEEIQSDIKLDRRPLLAEKGIEELERLYHERIEIYREAADFIVDNRHGYAAGMRDLERIAKEQIHWQ